ncbi:MAG TPA: pyridoxamine 5'-phosphate oxidase family protein [Acidimicrobiales bacterium]|nr:pyridoxamine 5'-phosphate oxidase family protein [Acidimicrobiales bacterium]
MTDRCAATELWTEALRAPTDEARSRLEAVLAEGVTAVSPLGATEGRAAVLAGFGASPLAPLLAQAQWSEPEAEGDVVVTSCRFPSSAPVGGLTLRLTFDAANEIVRAETELLAAPPPPAIEVGVSDQMAAAINGALANGTPVVMAYIDGAGRPHVSPRGSTQVFSADQLAVWARNPEGGLLAAIPARPNVSFFYRDPAARVTYHVMGRARLAESEDIRRKVYERSPEIERNLDPQRRGAAVIIDIDKVEGRDANGPVLMERGAPSE